MARIPEDTVEQVRQSVDIVEDADQLVPLGGATVQDRAVRFDTLLELAQMAEHADVFAPDGELGMGIEYPLKQRGPGTSGRGQDHRFDRIAVLVSSIRTRTRSHELRHGDRSRPGDIGVLREVELAKARLPVEEVEFGDHFTQHPPALVRPRAARVR